MEVGGLVPGRVVMPARMQRINNSGVPIYQHSFTGQDVRGLLAFYRTAETAEGAADDHARVHAGR